MVNVIKTLENTQSNSNFSIRVAEVEYTNHSGREAQGFFVYGFNQNSGTVHGYNCSGGHTVDGIREAGTEYPTLRRALNAAAKRAETLWGELAG